MGDYVPTENEIEQIVQQQNGKDHLSEPVESLVDHLNERGWVKSDVILGKVTVEGRAGKAYIGQDGDQIKVEYEPNGNTLYDRGDPFSFSYSPLDEDEPTHREAARIIDDSDFSTLFSVDGWSLL